MAHLDLAALAIPASLPALAHDELTGVSALTPEVTNFALGALPVIKAVIGVSLTNNPIANIAILALAEPTVGVADSLIAPLAEGTVNIVEFTDGVQSVHQGGIGMGGRGFESQETGEAFSDE